MLQIKGDIGAASGYTSSNYPDPAVIDYQVKYKDTVGNFHFNSLGKFSANNCIYK